MPRWLTQQLHRRLDELDAQFGREHRTGPLVLEVHYRGGRPQLARLREVLAAPILLELSLTMVATTS